MPPFRPRPASDRAQALRALCECAYQPNARRVRAVLEHDWSDLPRIELALGRLSDPADPVSVSAVARGLLARAVEDLDPEGTSETSALVGSSDGDDDAEVGVRHPPVTSLDVVRWHILEDEPWASMEARLREEGRPLSRGTLIRRQQEFLPALERWASGGVSGGEDAFRDREGAWEVGPQRGGSVPGPRGRASRLWSLAWVLPAALVVIVVVGGAVLLWPGEERDGAEHVDAQAADASMTEAEPSAWQDENRRDGYVFTMNQRVTALSGTAEYRRLPEPYPPLPLPDLGPFVDCALPIERTPGQPEILLSHNEMGNPALLLTLYDPIDEQILWTSSFDAPCDDRLTHPGVGPEVCEETYRGPIMWYAGREGDLGAHAVVVALQDYSPTFVLFVDLDTGAVEGYYVHPGYLESGFVVDIDRDGRMEVVLGGQDNALDRAAVVALRPEPGRRAASSVQWNTTGQEGGLARVLLPRAEEAVRARGANRLMVVRDLGSYFDYTTRILPVGVGVLEDSYFHVRLGPDLIPVDGALELWDADHVHLRELDLAPDVVTTWQADLIRIEGTDG